MADGFLGRWSQRKLDVKEGKPVAEPVVTAPPPPSAVPAPAPVVAAAVEPVPVAPQEPPPPTLADAQALTPESDFKPFMGRQVSPEVKNAAMKKLFADPHYNVMDRLDTYIDDYSQPDPIPHAMLRQLASAKFLGLFREEEEAEEKARQEALPTTLADQPRDVADNPTSQSVAQSPDPTHAVPPPPEHDDPDLRLQPNHATPGQKPGSSA